MVLTSHGQNLRKSLVLDDVKVQRESYEAYKAGKRIIVNQGGTSSGKSYGLSKLFIALAYKEKLQISFCSLSFPHLRKGILRDWRTIMETAELYNVNEHTRTEQTYYYPSGSYIEFFSVDDHLKVRGPRRDLLFINEANLIDFDTFTQLLLRTRIAVFIDYNPADEFHWIYDKVLTRPDCAFIKSTYKDNPFLADETIKEIENLRNVDSNFWRIYGEGERGHSEGVIYTHWQPFSELRNAQSVFGLDFGYNNPTALIRVSENDQNLYWKEEIYQSHLTNSDLIPMIKQIVKPHESIYCDTAEPNRIEELRRAGIKAVPANKDVKLGIDFVKSRKLYIDSGSANLLKEIKSYKYLDQGKRKGNEPETPLKLNDHCFTGDTLIWTNDGAKEIRDIEEMDLVYTSKGLKPVHKVWDNGYKQIQDYWLQLGTLVVHLRCTPDHLIKTNKGWKQISKLKSGMMLSLISSLRAENISYNLEKGILSVTSGTSMSKYGNQSIASAQQDTTYIIKTATPGTTTQQIWKLCQPTNTYQTIVKKESNKTRSGLRNFGELVLNPLKVGIKAMKDWLGIENTPSGSISVVPIMDSETVNFVESSLEEKPRATSFVILTAKLERFAKGEKYFARVYDLTVDDTHEYFANGILVHNCMDAARYGSLHFKKAKTGLGLSFHR